MRRALLIAEGSSMILAYPQYPKFVSIDQIEQDFLSDHNMYLHASIGHISDISHLEIHHSDEEDEECELFLYIGSEEDMDNDEFLTLSGVCANRGNDLYQGCSLEEAVRFFRIDRSKAIWTPQKESSDINDYKQ